MKLSDFNYHLPKELIAQKPPRKRSSSRLMVLNGSEVMHRRFYDIVKYLQKGDVLVVNDSRVMPARLFGRKKTGGRVEVLLVKKDGKTWKCLIKGKNIRAGTEIIFNELKGVVTEKKGNKFKVDFDSGNFEKILEKHGKMPIPPYIKGEVEKSRYQTVYASNPGSIAAPTAGLHFTKRLLKEIESRGVKIASVTLHVGLGTFEPVKVEDITQHRMEAEYLEIGEKDARIINKTRGRLAAVGTTALKALESASDEDGNIKTISTWSNLFIYPSYKFKTRVDCLITNFHLPKSTLLMLVCAYAGRERILNAYDIAIKNSYRFYSFGDAMLCDRYLHKML